MGPWSEPQPRPEGGMLRFRFYDNGKIITEDWLTGVHPDAGPKLARLHRAFTEAAEIAGHVWMIEIYNPDEPDDDDAYLRFGSDKAGMIMPIRVVVVGDDDDPT